jgi:hypothetical protein
MDSCKGKVLYGKKKGVGVGGTTAEKLFDVLDM